MTRGTRGPLVDRRDDCYETPPAAVKELLRVETLPEVIWECACGPGAIVRELREVGHEVYATDLVDFDCPDSGSRIDFLMERHPGFHVDGLITSIEQHLASLKTLAVLPDPKLQKELSRSVVLLLIDELKTLDARLTM